MVIVWRTCTSVCYQDDWIVLIKTAGIVNDNTHFWVLLKSPVICSICYVIMNFPDCQRGLVGVGLLCDENHGPLSLEKGMLMWRLESIDFVVINKY